MGIRRTAAVGLAGLVLWTQAPAPADAAVVIIAPGGGPHVRTFSPGGGLASEFMAYSPSFPGGAHVATGDVDGDGHDEVITGAGPGGGPHVRVFGLAGDLRSQFFAYDTRFAGGVQVAAADVDGDGRDEIVTGAGPTGGPHVRVFGAAGDARGSFFAYDPAFPGGVHVAAADLDGDDRAEIVTGAGPGGGPHVRVFTPTGGVDDEWFAFDTGFTGGVSVAAGQVDGSRRVVVGAGPGGGPHVKVFSASGGNTGSFFAYDAGFRGGVRVAAGSLGSTGRVVTGPGPGGGPHVRVFSGGGSISSQFFAYGTGYGGGVNVAVAGHDGRIVTGAGVERVVEILRPGDTGPRVANLQQRLLDMGYWQPGVDGTYSANTVQAVYAFQKANGLPRDGAIGPEDRGALDAGARPASVSTSGDLVEVDKARQLLFVVRGGRALWTFNTSTGNNQPYSSGGTTYRAVTPEGRFTFSRQIDGTRVSHLGQLYRPKYFTSVGHAIHGSPSIPPYPASHGCVRLSNPAISFIWGANLAPLGSQIWVHA